MLTNPYQISAFTQAAREGSFTRAAEKLGVTQSSVTQHVANLERVMGTKLFLRRRDGLELTRAGSELFAISDRISTLEQLIDEKVANYSEISAGHLKVVGTAPRPALAVIARYAEQFPLVQVECTQVSWKLAMQLLHARATDVAFVTDPAVDNTLYSRPLETTRYRVYARPGHPFTLREKIFLHDLAVETLVVPANDSFTQRVLHRRCRELGVSLTRLIATSTFPLVAETVRHGVGVGLMLDDCISMSPDLIGIDIADMNDTYCNCLITPADKRELRFVRKFIDVALDVFDPIS